MSRVEAGDIYDFRDAGSVGPSKGLSRGNDTEMPFRCPRLPRTNKKALQAKGCMASH